MISKQLILKSIDDAITKCGITLKAISQAITSTIQSLTDTPHEYVALMEQIPRFYRDKYKLDHEELYIQDYDGGEYYNEEGDDRSVSVPDEVFDARNKHGGLLLSMHNHPNGDSCFQSSIDFEVGAELGEKYMVTVAKDGIMVSKQDDSPKSSDYIGYIVRKQSKETVNMLLENEETYGINAIKEKFANGELTEEEAHSKVLKILQDYYADNISDEVKELDRRFRKADVGISTTYIKVK